MTNTTNEPWVARFQVPMTGEEWPEIPEWAVRCSGGYDSLIELLRANLLKPGDTVQCVLKPGETADIDAAARNSYACAVAGRFGAANK